MPMLKVRCAKCRSVISTGIEMTYEAFREATLMTRTSECPNCKHLQKWTLDDVDRSVFPSAKRPM